MEVLQRDADPATFDAPVGDDLVHHLSRHVDWNGKTDADIAAGWRNDGRVDADEFSAQADQCSAGIAWVDRGVGLDELLIALLADAGAPQRADKTGRYGLSQAEGIADRQHEIADFERVAVAEGKRLEARRV